MNKTAIKNFAVWARNKLIADITYKAGLIGVSEDGIAEPLPQSTRDLQFFDIGTKDYVQVAGKDIEQRNALVKAIREKEQGSDYATAFKAIIEEIAYTWFNRLIAIRFMEVNDYLPSRIRVLSSENPAKNEPDFVTTPFDTDIEFTDAEADKIMQLKDENKLDELFRMLFIKQCNKLHEILPQLFEKTNDYTELLLTISFTDQEGVVWHLVHDIEEENFDIEKEGQVEIIGWMYQFYNIEPKAAVFSKKSGKISKEEIPAATQLFTPEWIVKYMVENSLGRLWVDHLKGNGDRMHIVPDGQKVKSINEWDQDVESIKKNWKYYLDEAEQEEQVEEELWNIRFDASNKGLADIKVIDPCMGSGHILVYCFEVLMQIYESQGYTQRDAVQSILENNLFGLDIDKRAAQLSYFALMMKARQYDRRIFNRGVQPNVMAIKNSVRLSQDHMNRLGNEKEIVQRMISDFKDMEEYGSILNVEYTNEELKTVKKRLETIDEMSSYGNLIDMIESDEVIFSVLPMLTQAKIMSQKYDVVITNPPYMSVSAAGAKLNDYVKKNYPDSKTDLFAVFIEKCREMLVENGYQAMITMHSWMFLSSYEKLRGKLQYVDIVNMLHLGARAFAEISGEVVQVTSFIFRKSDIEKYKGTYCRLIDPTTQEGKEEMFLEKKNRYVAMQADFFKIPGFPVVYWAKGVASAFESGILIGEKCIARSGLSTGNNEKYMRLWFEPNYNNIGWNLKTNDEYIQSNKKFVPCNKGGEFRKWYGNNTYVIDWTNPESMHRPRTTYMDLYFKPAITWSVITSGNFSSRYYGEGFLFDHAAASLFVNQSVPEKYILAFINSKVAQEILNMINPTINTGADVILRLPIYLDGISKEIINRIEHITLQNINMCMLDWDCFETSWDFKKHPLITIALKNRLLFANSDNIDLKECYCQWENECNERFCCLKENEEELNRIFINEYGLLDELTFEIENRDVTVRKADLGRDIRSLLSYAVGCMFGRYSLDVEGLVYAGGDWDHSKYSTFLPDKDNCIPITDEEYFEDDIVGRFCDWMKKVFGVKSLETNLDYIAKALGNKGTTSREVIRNYFLNDFFKDHCSMYSVTGSGKRPIYWLFDSGKQNGFKALVYMHRWNADTVGNLRVEYLHKTQHLYEREIQRMQEIEDSSSDSKEISKAKKRREKLQKQLKETKDYDALLNHIALSRIDIDLDDGIKVNYEKVQTGRDGKKMQILAKI